jgi:hypothetical protein
MKRLCLKKNTLIRLPLVNGEFKKSVFLKTSAIILLLVSMTMTGCAPVLHSAAYRGDIDVVKDLLDKGANVNEWYGGTALLSASSAGHANVVKLLIERGANVNTMSDRGDSALGYAAIRGHKDVMKILIDNGANIDAAIMGLERNSAILASYPEVVARNKMGIKQLEKLVAKQEIVSQPITPVLRPSQESAASIKSDIDDLPAINTKPNKKAYAIVIGIEQYRQKLPRADYAVSDAKLISKYLSKVMGYPEENIVTLTNEHAAKSDLEKYFEQWLANHVEKGSSVFVYYSGHGAPNPKTGDAYLVPYDGDPSFIAQTGYSLKRLYEALGKLPAKEIIVALDSCFSGAGGRSVLAKGARPLVMNLQSNTVLSGNMTVMSASSGEQISSTYDEKGHGLFTYFMLKGIKNEDFVRQNGSIAVSDLFSYIKPQVERIARRQYNNEQTPQLIVPRNN